MEILKISSKSNPNSVAGAIAGMVKESQKAEMQAIGAGALNQAVKAVAIARGFVAPSGVDLVCIPAFAEVEVEGEDRTGIKLIVESRKWDNFGDTPKNQVKRIITYKEKILKKYLILGSVPKIIFKTLKKYLINLEKYDNIYKEKWG